MRVLKKMAGFMKTDLQTENGTRPKPPKVGAGGTAKSPNTALQGTLRDKAAQRP